MSVLLIIAAWLVCAALAVAFWIPWWRQSLPITAQDLSISVAFALLLGPMATVVMFCLFLGYLVGRFLKGRANWDAVIIPRKDRR